MKLQSYISLLLILATGLLQACRDNEMPDSIIATNDIYTLAGDSLVMHDTIVYSTDGKTIVTNIPDSSGNAQLRNYSVPTSPSGTVSTQEHLIDALSGLSSLIINDPANLVFASNTEAIDAIGLTLAYINPDLSMNLLRDMVEDSVVMGKNNSFYPAYNNRMAWTTAAWKVYLANGDKQWLRYAYDVSCATFEQEQEIAFYKRDWLVRGCSSDATPLVDALPEWMGNSDVFSTFTLSNNVETAGALAAMSEMADELGEDGAQYARYAQDLKAATNENLWNENHGQYTSFIYGQSCTLHAPCCDNRAQALAVLWGIADEDERASTLIEKTAITHCGVNNLYPARNHTLEPCLNEKSWGITQGLWNLASAHVGNDNALRRGLAALWRAQALYSTVFINAGSLNLDVTCALSNIAMTHRLIAGMNFVPDGIEFAPVVPVCFAQDKMISGFKYRKGTLDITVKGTGRDVAELLLDGKKINGTFIPASSLAGNHTISITMQEGHDTSQGVTIARSVMRLPETPVVQWNGDSARIFNYNKNLKYKLLIDGASSLFVNDSVFALPQTDKFSEICMIAADHKCFSYASRPYIVSGSNFRYFPVSHSSANNDLTLNINVPEGGDYMMSISYTSSSSTCDARIVRANTHKQGVTLLSGLYTDSIADQSNLIHVDLLRNNNVITISGLPVCHGEARPITINLYKK